MTNNQLQQRTPHEVCANNVKGMLNKHKASIIKSLPAGFKYERMARAVINAISTTPSLGECTPESLFTSIVKGFALGLEPNGLLGHGYLVPFKDRGKKKAQFMPGYRGLIDLARRTGQISEIYATEVYASDVFEVSMGTSKELIHKPDPFSDRGEVKGWYAVFKLKDGSVDFEIMGRSEIEKIKNISKAGGSNYSPWNSDGGAHFNEMARKTVIKKLLKRAPQSIEVARAVEDDNKVAMGEAQDDADIIDVVGGTASDEQTQHDSKTDRLAESLGASDNEYSDGDVEKVRRCFHATGKEVYGESWDAARAQICETYGVESSKDLSPDQYAQMIAQMKAMSVQNKNQ